MTKRKCLKCTLFCYGKETGKSARAILREVDTDENWNHYNRHSVLMYEQQVEADRYYLLLEYITKM